MVPVEPIRYRDDLDMYRYVENYPTGFVDPTGLSHQDGPPDSDDSGDRNTQQCEPNDDPEKCDNGDPQNFSDCMESVKLE